MKFLCLTGMIVSLQIMRASTAEDETHLRKPRSLIYPLQSIVQLATGVATPAQVAGRTINTNMGLMFNINLPTNQSRWYPYRPDYRKKRSTEETNNMFYSLLEAILSINGMDGRSCISKSVCQLREVPLEGNDLGHKLIDLIFGHNQPHTKSYFEPREHLNTSCDITYPSCPYTPIDALTDLI
uniref:Uncharacterized protein n=2 Tax=Clastoptera arizonana TaxID=38151 RepID=A0A1B6CZC6_9HEMI